METEKGSSMSDTSKTVVFNGKRYEVRNGPETRIFTKPPIKAKCGLKEPR